MEEVLPHVSIIVPTMRSRTKFIHLVVRNLISQTYPSDKIEVLVVGDEDHLTRRVFEDISSVFEGRKFRYIACGISDNIGQKRNFCCEQASHKIIAMMDDDDMYNREYIEHSVRELRRLKKGIVGCKDMIITWPSLDFETRYVKGSSIHEGTMVFRKSHWKRNKFKECKTGEGVQMVRTDDGSSYNDIDIRKIMMCVAHDSNTFNKTPILSNGTPLAIGEDKKQPLRAFFMEFIQ